MRLSLGFLPESPEKTPSLATPCHDVAYAKQPSQSRFTYLSGATLCS